MAFLDELQDERDDPGICPPRAANIRPEHAQGVHRPKVLASIRLCQLHRVYLAQASAGDDLILPFAGQLVREVTHVGDVLNIQHPIAAVSQVANDRVEGDIRLGMPKVRQIVHRRPAHVHPHEGIVQRGELLFASSEVVIECYGHQNPHPAASGTSGNGQAGLPARGKINHFKPRIPSLPPVSSIPH